MGRTEGLTWRHLHLDRSILCVQRAHSNVGSPPAWEAGVGEVQGEEDQNRAKGESYIQTGRQDVVVLHPPATPAVADVLIEDKAHDTPAQVVQRSGRRNQTRTTEDDRSVEVPDWTTGEGAGTEVEGNWEDDTSDPEEHHGRVHLAGGEDSCRTDDTPDHGSIEEDSAVRATVVVDLGFGADALDGSESPIHDGDLDD